jgi:hypothetical protein
LPYSLSAKTHPVHRGAVHGAGGQDPVDLVQRDPPFRPVADGLGHARGRAPARVGAPVLGQE